MAYIAQVVDGKLQQESTTQSAQNSRSSGSSLDKDAFLQLLVAQMKYQDPLQPTSNTEYISQLATFSELEEMQNLVANSDKERATGLVGEVVTMKITSESGNISYEQGVVDYVTYEGSKTLLGINGGEYSIDDLVEVADSVYVEAYAMASAVVTALNKLPTLGALTIQDKEAVNSITKVYDEMDEYQQSFLSKEQKESIEAYRAKMDELVKIYGAATGDDNTTEDSTIEGAENNTTEGTQDNTTE